jgi:hypothetical protein
MGRLGSCPSQLELEYPSRSVSKRRASSPRSALSDSAPAFWYLVDKAAYQVQHELADREPIPGSRSAKSASDFNAGSLKLSEKYVGDESARLRFLREARAAAKVRTYIGRRDRLRAAARLAANGCSSHLPVSRLPTL